MKKYFFMIAIVTGSAALLTSCSSSSHVEMAQGVNFSNYKTFAWANDSGIKKSGRVDNDIVDNNIKNSISTELEKKGWTETDQQPDVLLDYNVVVKKGVKKKTEPAYTYPYSGYFYTPGRHRLFTYYNPWFFRGYRTYNVPFKEGTLTVNMTDARNNQLIWEGWSKGDLSSKSITTKDVKDDVKSIFKKFDLPKINS